MACHYNISRLYLCERKQSQSFVSADSCHELSRSFCRMLYVSLWVLGFDLTVSTGWTCMCTCLGLPVPMLIRTVLLLLHTRVIATTYLPNALRTYVLVPSLRTSM